MLAHGLWVLQEHVLKLREAVCGHTLYTSVHSDRGLEALVLGGLESVRNVSFSQKQHAIKRYWPCHRSGHWKKWLSLRAADPLLWVPVQPADRCSAATWRATTMLTGRQTTCAPGVRPSRTGVIIRSRTASLARAPHTLPTSSHVYCPSLPSSLQGGRSASCRLTATLAL